MLPVRTLMLAIVLFTTTLAGCISSGGDDVNTPDPTPTAQPTEETGSIKGQVVTNALDPVKNAAVAAIGTDGMIAVEATTSESGDYVMNGLAPGTYRVQVSSICCKAGIQSVDVAANAVAEANFKLDELTAQDLKAPHVEDNEWSGFIACGAGAGVPGVLNPKAAICSAADDPNDDFIHYFKMAEGVQSVVIGMDWTPVGGVSGAKLSLDFEEGVCEEVACADAYTYASADGDPPFVLRVDLEDIADEDASWSNITGEAEFKFRVFAGSDYASVIYQQPFNVYWYEFYHHKAPEDFNPLPDA